VGLGLGDAPGAGAGVGLGLDGGVLFPLGGGTSLLLVGVVAAGAASAGRELL
jgi:hypothetical protein